LEVAVHNIGTYAEPDEQKRTLKGFVAMHENKEKDIPENKTKTKFKP